MSAPHRREWPGATGQNANINADIPILATAETLGNTQKQLATVRAQCALAGVTLHPLENDHGKTVYIVSRWALTRELESLEAVSAWLARVVGVHHE